jgi:hypothetical protein
LTLFKSKSKPKKDNGDSHHERPSESDWEPTQGQIDFHEGILSIIDDDIAKTFRDFGYLRYGDARVPLLAQLTRNLRDIVGLMADRDIQICSRDQGNDNSGENKNF